jgi:hypothetical protein
MEIQRLSAESCAGVAADGNPPPTLYANGARRWRHSFPDFRVAPGREGDSLFPLSFFIRLRQSFAAFWSF